MPRYPENSPDYVAHKKAIAERAEMVGLWRTNRDFHDPKRRSELYAAAQGILDFASRSEDLAVLTAMIAILPCNSMELVMLAVEDVLTPLAPRLRGRPIEFVNDEDRRKVFALSDAIDALPSLREHYCGTSTMSPSVTGAVDQDGVPEASGDVEPEWIPPDEATPEILRTMLPVVLGHKEAAGILVTAREGANRMAILAEAAIRELLASLSRDGRGGLSMPEIGRRVAAQEGKQSEGVKAVHERLVQEVGSLQDALLRGLAQVPDMLIIDVESLEQAAEAWCQECLPLLGVARHTLESKRKVLRGAVANVVQYAHLIRGSISLPGFLGARWGLRVVAQTIMQKLESLDPKVRDAAASRAKFREHVADKLELATGIETVVTAWRKRLGPDAAVCGRLAGLVCKNSGNQRPWRLRDHIVSLTRAKILDGKTLTSRQRQMMRLLGRMQQVGIAFQVPWDYVHGRRRAPPQRPDGNINPTGSKWVLNPLAKLLSTGR